MKTKHVCLLEVVPQTLIPNSCVLQTTGREESIFTYSKSFSEGWYNDWDSDNICSPASAREYVSLMEINEEIRKQK